MKKIWTPSSLKSGLLWSRNPICRTHPHDDTRNAHLLLGWCRGGGIAMEGSEDHRPVCPFLYLLWFPWSLDFLRCPGLSRHKETSGERRKRLLLEEQLRATDKAGMRHPRHPWWPSLAHHGSRNTKNMSDAAEHCCKSISNCCKSSCPSFFQKGLSWFIKVLRFFGNRLRLLVKHEKVSMFKDVTASKAHSNTLFSPVLSACEAFSVSVGAAI